MPRKSRNPVIPPEQQIPELVRLWCLRILVRFKLWREFAKPEDGRMSLFHQDTLTAVLGQEIEDYLPQEAFHRILTDTHRALEARAPDSIGEPLEANLDWLCAQLDLNEVERDLLRFAVVLHTNQVLRQVTDELPPPLVERDRLEYLLATILGRTTAELVQALRPDGKLITSGLISLKHSSLFGGPDLDDVLETLDDLPERLLLEYTDPMEMMRPYFSLEPATDLTLEDYAHRRDAIETLHGLLEQALRGRKRGVNVLVYGPPGTGKTELSRLMGRLCKAQVHAISCTREDGEDLKGRQRLMAFRLAQALLRGSGEKLIVFDELEDAFGGLGGHLFSLLFGERPEGPVSKAWINRTLESNPVPTIWIGNDISGIDPAWLRRFDLILEMPLPPADARERMIRRHLRKDEPVRERWIGELARTQWLSPATIERALRVARLRGRERPEDFEADMAAHVNGLAQALGEPMVASERQRGPVPFDPALLNTDPSPELLTERLRLDMPARLCFYGPPGTGKTEFARVLAERSGRPLMVRHASDLLDKYVGQTEQAIARMFHEAEQREALLLVDEVESFLGQRETAQRNWEVSMVNELLTQLERFRGTCIVTTNLIERFDRAALRRFDLKVHFRPLTAEQRWHLFVRVMEQEGVEVPEMFWPRLSALDGLTPGDYAAVYRGQKLLGTQLAPGAFLSALEEEIALREQRTDAA